MNNPTFFDYMFFWFGAVFLTVCLSALFYDFVYKPLRDKFIVWKRMRRLDILLWVGTRPRLMAFLLKHFDNERGLWLFLGLITVAGLLIGYLLFRVVFMGSLL